ncbi:unnamed protein product [Hymenolepis diminuta]|uniref:Uncharacterized protein n=1 Tax=Hymenolepis diminuta TaxID=6216 RepID=A0A564YLF6_HYMDI|nr:unnamed protein product [Hymenolepis diminuta]
MTHKPYLPCLNAPIDSSPPFSLTASLHLKPHLRSCSHAPLPNSYASCSSPLFLSKLPPSLSVTRFKLVVIALSTIWPNQFLVFCSTIFVSSYPNSYELVTFIAVVKC